MCGHSRIPIDVMVSGDGEEFLPSLASGIDVGLVAVDDAV